MHETVEHSAVRRFRTVASYCCVFFCLVAAASWFRSYHSYAWIRVMPFGKSEVCLQPWRGRVELYVYTELLPHDVGGRRWVWFEVSRGDAEFEHRAELMSDQGIPSHGFRIQKMRRGWTVSVPHWLLTLVSAIACIALRPSPRLQFRLRDMLVVVTIVAIVLGSFKSLPWLLAPPS